MLSNILGFPPQTFMIIIAAGFFIGLTIYRLDKTGIGNKMVNRLLVVCIIAAFGLIVGARFFDCFWHAVEEGYFTSLGSFIKDKGFFQALGMFWEYGGITFLGGLYGCLISFVIAYWFIFRHERHNLIHYLNIILPGLILAHGLGRIGCFFDGCCTGVAAPEPFGMIFPHAYVPEFQPEGYVNPTITPVLPTNLYEGLFLIALFFVLFFGIKKGQTKIYFVSYGIFRFFLEFLRGDSRGAVPFISWLSPSQLLSIILLIVGVLLFFFESKLTEWLKKFDKPLKTIKKTKKANA